RPSFFRRKRSAMLEKLAEVDRRYTELEQLLVDPSTLGNRKDFARLAKERSDLEEIVAGYRQWKRLTADLEEHKALLEGSDADLRELAKAELRQLREQCEALEARLKILLLPKDPNDEKSVVLEIRAGTGGDEASLFAAELFRMYSHYAESRRWRIEILSANPT